MSVHALASLTATYTDSEGEEDGENRDDKSPKSSETTTSSIDQVVRPQVSRAPAKRLAGLEAYQDDQVVSDEDDLRTTEMDVEYPDSVENLLGGLNSKKRTDVTANLINSFHINFDDIDLPPDPDGRCSNELQEKIARLHEKMQTEHLDMNEVIQQKKAFRNPSIYEKLIQFCGIDELATNYPIEMYDPHRWTESSYYDELAKVQKAEMDRREKEKRERTKVEFVSGTKKIADAIEEAKKRKSKWDQVGAGPTSVVKPAGLVPQQQQQAASGTKGTVISAFGSLPKKTRPS